MSGRRSSSRTRNSNGPVIFAWVAKRQLQQEAGGPGRTKQTWMSKLSGGPCRHILGHLGGQRPWPDKTNMDVKIVQWPLPAHCGSSWRPAGPAGQNKNGCQDCPAAPPGPFWVILEASGPGRTKPTWMSKLSGGPCRHILGHLGCRTNQTDPGESIRVYHGLLKSSNDYHELIPSNKTSKPCFD